MSNKQPIFLLINDIHVSKDNISAFQLNWKEAVDVCKQYGIKEILLGGDLWQARSAQTLSTLQAVKEMLDYTKRNDIAVYIAEGNHDKVDQESIFGYNHIFDNGNDDDLVCAIDRYMEFEVSGNICLIMMSYFPENGSFIDILNEIKKGMQNDISYILYIHEGINGGLSHSSEDELPANIFDDFEKVLVGHYHDRKRIPGTSIEYIGASRQHNFGEDEEKGYTIVYSDGSTEFIKNEVNDRYVTIEIDEDEITDDLVQEIESLRSDSRYKVKLKVNCTSSSAKNVDRKKLLDVGVTKIELVTDKTAIKLTNSQSINKKFDKDGLKDEYKVFCKSQGIDNVDMGLKYLNAIQQ